MNPSVYLLLLLVCLIYLTTQRRNNYIAHFIQKKRGGQGKMVELAKQFLGKKCVFSMFNSTQVSGILKEISGNAVLVEENGVCEAVNLDFVTRIREIPEKKKKK